MSRSGYSEDLSYDDPLQYGRWRGVVASATRGKRGQQLLKELLVALDEMPEKKLITNSLKNSDGCYCTLGVLGEKRGLKMENLDPEDYEIVATEFGVAAPLVQEIVFMNDEWHSETPEERWARMRKWVECQINE